jgi:hypothetical protein
MLVTTRGKKTFAAMEGVNGLKRARVADPFTPVKRLKTEAKDSRFSPPYLLPPVKSIKQEANFEGKAYRALSLALQTRRMHPTIMSRWGVHPKSWEFAKWIRKTHLTKPGKHPKSLRPKFMKKVNLTL